MRPPPVLLRSYQLPIPRGRPSSTLPCRLLSASSRRPPPRSRPPPSTLSSSSASRFNGNGNGKSTGISYLDTWMGNQTNTRRVGPATATSISSMDHNQRTHPLPPRNRNSMPTATTTAVTMHQSPHQHAPSSPASASASTPVNAIFSSPASSTTIQQQSSSSYQLVTVTPNKSDTPESFLQRLQHQQKQIMHSSTENKNTSSTSASTLALVVPLVLDLSSFHPDGSPHYTSAPSGTLTGFIDAIIQIIQQQSSQSAVLGYSYYHLVGVSNLPPNDKSMAHEVQMANLPIFQSTTSNNSNSSNTNPQHVSCSTDGSIIPSALDTPTRKKKRGGVAPLLRQRRPGVAATSSTAPSTATVVNSDEDTTSSTLSTSSSRSSDETTTASTTSSQDSLNTTNTNNTVTSSSSSSSKNNKDIQIVGMGNLPPFNGTINPATKVHKGSIRSGQLLSSDRPNQSLVIIGSINPGGEVWSEGDVYVFGKLRGRVLAGLSNVGGKVDDDGEGNGDGTNSRQSTSFKTAASQKGEEEEAESKKMKSSSKIFATHFDPELICIGDTFTTIDNVEQTCGLEGGIGPAMVAVDEDTGELVFGKIEL